MINSFPAFKKVTTPCWLILFYFLSTANFTYAQQAKDTNWDSWMFLLGDWVGEGGGGPGQGGGEFSFSYDLQRRVLIRKNFAEYPAAEDRPAFRHDDLMIIFQESDETKAIYFDNEGHVINYTVSFSGDKDTITFLGEVKPSAPTFRLSYIKVKNETVKILFEIAPPGKPEAFSKYIEASANKIKLIK
ncbi:MAG: hypothetical protein NTX22_11310 [Ignavibacteriales bacterium]|nr:hypothetical protein [Ignavibacteriales bacterium]